MKKLDPENDLDNIDLHLGVLSVEWNDAEILDEGILVPCTMINGEKKYISMSNKFIISECEAPSVAEYLANKQNKAIH